jgi:hypothetical protein
MTTALKNSRYSESDDKLSEKGWEIATAARPVWKDHGVSLLG